MSTTNFLKFDSETEAAAFAVAARDPAKGLHTKVADNPLFVELVYNADIAKPVPAAPEKPEAGETYSDALARFVATLTSRKADDYADRFPNLPRPGFEVHPGRVYDKIVTGEFAPDGTLKARSVFCFIRKADGAVLKAASWKAPAKHARGTIYGDWDAYGVTLYGARYL